VRRVSNSEVQTFKECRRKWWLAWYRGLRAKRESPVGALRSGTRVHRALEVLYVPEGVEPGNPLVALAAVHADDWEAYVEACAEWNEQPDPEVHKEFTKACDLERAMVEGYLEWLEETGVDAEIVVVAPEQELQVPGSVVGHDDVQLIGKLDVRVLRRSDGKRLFMDHKTAASLTEPLKTLRENEQMLFYHILELHQLVDSDDERCVGALYNMLKKVKRTNKATPPFYVREFIPHNDAEIESFKMRLHGIIADMLFIEQQLATGYTNPLALVYPHRTKDCSWKCEFNQLCPMFDDGSRAEDMVVDRFEERNPLDRYKLVRDAE
jgi:PD-(D/E)XK nuclease superfamily protein